MSVPPNATLTAVPVRELLKLTPKQLLDGLKVNMYVYFEDSVVEHLSKNEVILLRYLLELLVVAPNLPIVSKYSISKYYTNGMYASKTFNKCFKEMLKDIVAVTVKINNDNSVLDMAYSIMQEIFNAIYNEVSFELLEYVSSADIEDYLELQSDPELIEAMRRVADEKSVIAVNNTYKVLDNVMKKNYDNPIARGYIAGSINPNQIKQMLASRGYITEIDSFIFKNPVASSFVLGLNNIHDISIESRAGAKALYLSNRAVQQSEYFARELQLVTMVVEKLVFTDCGNHDYIPWFVRPESDTNKADLPNLIGTRFFNEEKGVEEPLEMSHKSLVEGKTIKLRAVHKCKLEDKRHICSACFGELSYGIHTHTNIGHYCATAITQKISQSILSTKHLTSSATSGDVVLDEVSKQFFHVKNNFNYAFRPGLIAKSKSKFKMLVSQQDAFGIKDLNPSVDMYTLNPSRVSKIESIIIVETTPDGKEKASAIAIKDNNKYGSFTVEFIYYIITSNYTLDENERYIIDLSNWCGSEPVINMPQLEYNFLALSNNIKNKFKWMKLDNVNETRESMLSDMFDLINSKLDVNIALIGVIIYAFTIMSNKERNFDIGRNADNPSLMRIEGIIGNRSLGGAYAWEKVLNWMLNPKSFYGNNAIDHPLDVLIKPNETIIDYYGGLPSVSLNTAFGIKAR